MINDVMTGNKASRTGIAIGTATALAIVALIVFEQARPLRKPAQPRLRRAARNITMGIMCAAMVAGVEAPAIRLIAKDNAERPRGLTNRLPPALRQPAAFLLMDYSLYLWHVATHRLPWPWRLHRVHHVDIDLDASTALRFHLIDMIVSFPWRCFQVRLSGIEPVTLERWQRFFFLSVLFHHANLRLPEGWDRRFAWLLTTPEMRGIHHSRIEARHESNWSSGFSLWDRLHGTFAAPVTAHSIAIGLPGFDKANDIAIEPSMHLPWRADTRPIVALASDI